MNQNILRLNTSILCSLLCLFLCSYGCDDSTSPSGDTGTQSAGEMVPNAGEMSAGVMAGTSIGNSGGESGGVNAGETSGELAGTTAGTSAGEMAGEMAGESAGNTAGTDIAGTDIGGEMAGEISGEMAGEVMGGEMAGNMVSCGVVSDWQPATQQGAIYLAHFLSSEVIRYRIHREFPLEDVRFDVGAEPHDAALDGVHDLYAVALNLPQTVKIYDLPRDEDYPGQMIPPPTLLSTLQLTPYTPRRVLFDSARQRLFVLTNAPLDGGLLEEMFLFIFDVSQPDAPIALTPEPTSLPVTTTLAIEPRAGLLALVDLNSLHLLLYDVSGVAPLPMPGDPIDLLTEFPEQGGQDSFQARNLQFDPLRGRLMLARAQGILSEVITYAYPAIGNKEPGMTETPTEECQAVPSYQDFTRIDDDFDVAQPIEERAHLLGAFAAIPMIGEPLVLFISYAWRAPTISSFVTLMRESDEPVLRNQIGCGDYEGFGCFYTSYYSGQSSTYNHLTDGAGCVDQNHRVFAGVGLEDDENSQLFLFRIDRDSGELTPILSETGRNLSTSAYPLHLGCH